MRLKNPALLPVEQAAKIMGIDPLTLKFALQQDKYPFGEAIQCAKSWRYLVYRKAFEDWCDKNLGIKTAV